MGASQPSTTTQISKVELPKWVDDASQKNYQFAQQIADKPYEAYNGQTVAGTSQDTLSAYDLLRSKVGSTSGLTDQAAALQTQAGKGIMGLNRSDYMNPYVDDVVNKSLAGLNDSRIQSLMGNADKAVASKAFGGSRSAVVDGVTNAETAKSSGLLASQLYGDAFNQATGAMQGDISSKLAAAGGLNSTATNENAIAGTDAAGLLTSGNAQEQAQQNLLDDAKGKWQDSQDYDTNRLNILLSALGMSPYGKTENTKSTSTGGSSGSDFASIGTGLLSLLGGIFSDENAKTDIEKLGKDPDTGLDIFAYRYKKDPKTYPKVIGPMAQDIEKLFPGKTKKIGRHRVVKVNLNG